jgi:hypothetical protein
MVFSKGILAGVMFAAVAGLGGSIQAAVVPFTEDFVSDNAAWKDAVNADLGFVGAGGPDGGSYVTGSFDFQAQAEGATPVLLRGQDGFDSSSDAFVGNWITDGVTEFSAFVRHDAPVPLTFFTRFVSSFNFPGAVAIDFVPVLPNTWTKVTFAISAASPQFISFETSDFNTVFSNIGNLQLGVSVPAALVGSPTPVTFDLDQPSITPEPATAGLMMAGVLVFLRRRASV